LVNLLENASKYSAADTSVTVTLEDTSKGICLSVTDEGIGIPDSEKPHIFKKFYRIGSEDTRKTKGTGLGLFIVKEVADRHQARIKIKNNLPAGTVFRIVFPPVAPQS
jgi:signal transduction histidine kinase